MPKPAPFPTTTTPPSPVRSFERARASVLVALVLGIQGCAHSPAPIETGEGSMAGSGAGDGKSAMAAAAAAYAAADWKVAETQLLAAGAALPADPEPWFKLGNLYVKTGRLDAAANGYQQCLKRAPAHAKAWHNLGIVRLRQARESFEHVVTGPTPGDDPLSLRAQKLRDLIDQATGSAQAASP